MPAATRIRMHRREIESRMRMRGRGGPRTVTLWGRENLNKENRRKALPLVNRRMGPRLGTFQEGWTRVMR